MNLKIKSVFPFQLFPDVVKLDDEQITIIQRGFMWRKVIPIKHPDLLNVILHEAPVFCMAEISSKYVTAPHIKVTHLTKKDGRKLVKCCMKIIENNQKGHQGGQ